MTRPDPTCRKCKVPMAPEPNHPGRELGSWWTHPLLPHGESIGHAHSVFEPNDQTRAFYKQLERDQIVATVEALSGLPETIVAPEHTYGEGCDE